MEEAPERLIQLAAVVAEGRGREFEFSRRIRKDRFLDRRQLRLDRAPPVLPVATRFFSNELIVKTDAKVSEQSNRERLFPSVLKSLLHLTLRVGDFGSALLIVLQLIGVDCPESFQIILNV